MLLRTDAVELLARARGSMLSIVTMQATAPWVALDQNDDRNLNLLGSMGSASSIGLGLAIARPDERVLVLDGDGSLLMQLASLVSIGEQRPSNLYHVVFENGTYETSGGQSVPGRNVADLCAIALGSGYRPAVRYTSVDEMADLPRALQLDGPVMISLVITGQGTVTRAPTRPAVDFATQIQDMRAALGSTAAAR